MKTKRVGCVAQRIIEKMRASFDKLSAEELAVHIYGDAGRRHLWQIRRVLRTLTLPEGWAFVPGPVARPHNYRGVIRRTRAKRRYFNHGRKA